MELALICLALIAFCAFRERAIQRERSEHEAERRHLLNRIQAPEVALRETHEPPAKVAKALPYDDDAAYWDYRKTLNGDED